MHACICADSSFHQWREENVVRILLDTFHFHLFCLRLLFLEPNRLPFLPLQLLLLICAREHSCQTEQKDSKEGQAGSKEAKPKWKS